MKSTASKFCVGVLTVMLALLGLAAPATAKSLYVIASQDSESTSRLQAYNVNADGTLTYQATYTPAGVAMVGLALDNASNTLFVSTEGSGYLTVIDARTMTSLGSPVLAPGAYDLAGIVMDEGKQLLYTVDRGTDQLYVYTWDATAKTLTLQPGSPHTLAGVKPPGTYNGAYGIALDKVNNFLFVANATDTIYKFNTSDWSPAGTVRDSVNPNVAISIAMDSRNQKLYTGAGFAYDPYLKQYSLTYGSTSRVQITGVNSAVDGVIGLDVDENTGYVYISTTYLTNELQVFDTTLTKIQTPDLTGHPLNGAAGLVVGAGYNLLNLSKTASPAYPTSVQAGRNVTYTITCDTVGNDQQVTNVIIRDNLPADTTFVSATMEGGYDPESHTVTWNVGTLRAGLARSFQLVAQVKPGTPTKIIVNNATISSAETPPSTQSAQTAVTAALAWGIAFPLPAYTAFTAPVSAVMDNSVLERTIITDRKFYVIGDVIKAFNDEIGKKQYGVKYMDPSGQYWPAYQNSTHTDFFLPSPAGVRPLNYINGPYLAYAGMPGYNYQVPAGSPVMATADGKLYKPDTDPVNGTPSYYDTFYIDHQNGYYSWYLYAPLSQAILAQISQNGYAQVTRGQIIGNTIGDHLHFEMRYNGIDHQNVVDPYKLGLWLPTKTGHVEAFILLLLGDTAPPPPNG